MQPVFKRTLLSSAVTLACYGGAAGAACPGTVSTAEGACNLPGTASVTITSTGRLPSLNVAAPGTGTVENEGRIASTNLTSAVLNYAGNLAGTLDNSGVVNNRQTGTDAYAIYIENGLTGTMTNSGTVRARVDTWSTAAGVYINQDDLAGTLTNTGTIEALGNGTSLNYAYGLYLNGATTGDITGTLTNEGTIAGKATGGTGGTAYGIYVEGEIAAGGSLTNSGTIEGLATGTGGGTAYGVYIDDGVAGTLSNTGTVRGRAVGPSSGGAAAGIILNDDLSGTLMNSGTVEGILEGSTWGTAYGIYVDGDVTEGASLTNTGTVSARSNMTAPGGAAVYGVGVSGDLLGELRNEGDIETKQVHVDKTTTGPGYGIYIGDDIGANGALVNTGTVSVDATGGMGGDSVYGIYVGGEVLGTLENTNAITVMAGGTTSSTAVGIYVDSDVETGAMLDNSGTITVQSTGGTEDSVYGIYIGSSVRGTVDNSGTITALVDDVQTSAAAYGIYIGSDLEGNSLTNSGTITATMVANAPGGTSVGGSAAGVSIDGDLLGLLDNSGSISASATVNGTAGFSTSSVYGYGIYLSGDAQAGSTLKNTGTITAHAQNSGALGTTDTDARIDAYGIYVGGDFSGTLVNTGSITATNSGAAPPSQALAFALYIDGDSSAGIFSNSGTIVGDVQLNGGRLNLRGGSIDGAITSVNALNINIFNVFMSSDYDLAGATINNFHVRDGGDWILNTTLPNVTDLRIFGGGRLTLALNGLNLMENVAGAGTLAVRSGVNATLTGNYTQNAGGTFEVGAKSATNFGKLNVTGTADLSASNRVGVAVTGLIAKDAVLEDVLTAGTLTTGAALSTTDDSLLYDFSAVIDGNTIDINSSRGVTVAGAVGDAGFAYAAGAAAALDELFDAGGTGGDIDGLLLNLASFTTEEELVNAVSQLVPTLVGQGGQLSNISADMFSSLVGSRIGGSRGANAGEHMLRDGHLWVRPIGGFGDQSARDGVPGFDLDTFGIAFGGDYRPSDRLFLGAAFSWQDTEIDGKTVNRNELNVDTYQFGLYGSYYLNATDFVDAHAIVGWNENDSLRDINFGALDATAQGDYDAIFTRIYAGLGREYRTSDRFTFSPIVSLRYTYIDEDGYTETGAGAFSLVVEDNDEDSLVLGLDGVGRYALDADGTYSVTVRGGVGYDVLTDDTLITSTFAGGGSAFATQGSEPDEFVYRGGVSLNAVPQEMMSFSVRYSFEGREDVETHGFSANFRWRF